MVILCCEASGKIILILLFNTDIQVPLTHLSSARNDQLGMSVIIMCLDLPPAGGVIDWNAQYLESL